jgi:hypothetical protein
MLIEADFAYRCVVAIFSVGLAISSLEYLAIRREFRADGLYSWPIVRTALLRRTPPPSIDRLLGAIYGARGVTLLLGTRLTAAVGLLLATPASAGFSVAAAILVVSHLTFSARQVFGDDGSDQMNSILAVTVFLCAGFWSTRVIVNAGLWFLALQACLSYFSAGAAKLVSETWRSGAAVRQIFDTGSYGTEAVARFLSHWPAIGILASWGVITFEILFPLTLIAPAPVTWAFLVCGTLFHVANAGVMGLNSFLWSFVATYPALLFVSTQLREFVHSLLAR